MTAGPRLTLSVVVCAYTLERWPDIVACVASVSRQSAPVAQILLVIDHNDDLAERARGLVGSEPGLTVLVSEGPRGLSGARNTGVAAARGDVVAFLDDDARADADWAAQLLAAYEDADVVGAGGTVRPDWRVPRPGWLPSEFLWVVGCSYLGQPEQRAQVRNSIGASMSFRRSTLTAVGGFDPSVGRIGKDAGGCEETELSIRAARTHPGSRIVLEPAALCHHAVTAERATVRYFVRRCAAEGRSKAVVASLRGSGDALAAERHYTRRVLPVGVARGLRELLAGDLDGGRRAAMIVVGLAVTATAYLSMRARLARTGRVQDSVAGEAAAALPPAG